jgi:small subunit ribosomal protein S6e
VSDRTAQINATVAGGDGDVAAALGEGDEDEADE